MKIGFVYNAPCNIAEIMSGSSPAPAEPVCYLAIYLAKLGHDVTIFSHGSNANAYNVRCRHFEIKAQALVLDPAIQEQDFALLIFKDTSPEFAISIKSVLPYQPKIYLWTGLEQHSPLMTGLSNPDIIAQLAGIVCVSAWQRQEFLNAWQIPVDKIFAIRYAIAPIFEDLYVDGKEFTQTKSKTLRIAYIANEDDGLDVLLDSYFNINDNYAATTFGIFTNVTKPELLDRIKESRGIAVYGNLPKTQLVAWLRTYTILANPTTIARTSNTTLLEAMSAGLYPVISDNGSNLDYAQGHGRIVKAELLHSDTLDNYISELLTVCQAQTHQPKDFFDYCFKQTVDMNKKESWHTRAKEWIDLLTGQ